MAHWVRTWADDPWPGAVGLLRAGLRGELMTVGGFFFLKKRVRERRSSGSNERMNE